MNSTLFRENTRKNPPASMFWVRVFCCLVTRKPGRVAKPVFWSHLFLFGQKTRGWLKPQPHPANFQRKQMLWCHFCRTASLCFCCSTILVAIPMATIDWESLSNLTLSSIWMVRNPANRRNHKFSKQVGRCESHITTEWGGKLNSKGD